MTRKRIIEFLLNGSPQEVLCEPRQTLLEILRDRLQYTGTKEGCNNGNCGACTVLWNGKPVVSCLVFGVEVDGTEIETIEGVADADSLAPLQQAFLEEAALQCGVCTPGIVMSAKALLKENPSPTEEEIRLALAGNLCRCTGYDKIVRAVQEAASKA